MAHLVLVFLFFLSDLSDKFLSIFIAELEGLEQLRAEHEKGECHPR
jgi:hypothetical protein